jgi:hypothetical protein
MNPFLNKSGHPKLKVSKKNNQTLYVIQSNFLSAPLLQLILSSLWMSIFSLIKFMIFSLFLTIFSSINDKRLNNREKLDVVCDINNKL